MSRSSRALTRLLYTPLLVGMLACPAVAAPPQQDAAWKKTRELPAAEAFQAAAADDKHVYAIASRKIARYDRRTGERLAESAGEAHHLNSGFLHEGKLYCAHSNYPQRPEKSQVMTLDLATMRLGVAKDFGDYGGSLTWVLERDGKWWCNFARYGKDNGQTFLVQFDADWEELGRWTYPPELVRELGNYSLSGGVWRGDELYVTGHDDPVAFRLKLPTTGFALDWVGTARVPFKGQGIANDPLTGGLVGIERARLRVIFAEPGE